MSNRKIRLAVLCGGKSAEHEVSLQSALNVVRAVNREKYDVFVVGIDHQGAWHLNDPADFLLHADDPKRIALKPGGEQVAFIPGNKDHQLIGLQPGATKLAIDVVFPVLHGTFGEDGTIQGLLKQADIPFVGADVLSSAACMDKDVMKQLLLQAGLPTAKYSVVNQSESVDVSYADLAEKLGGIMFVKPANLGSSVGISKVHNASEFETALQLAFQFDHKIIIEEFIAGRELECAVLGNHNPQTSVIGEIRPLREFYSYEAKYLDDKGAELVVPAQLPAEVEKQIKELAVRAFKATACEGMARIDFFLRGEDEVLINELNTIPGFTRISMYPKLWAASGLNYSDLIDRLIQLALDRHAREEQLRAQR